MSALDQAWGPVGAKGFEVWREEEEEEEGCTEVEGQPVCEIQGGHMVLKKIASFINWLGGPDRKSGRVLWRRGFWRNYGYENQVWVRGTWIRRQKNPQQGIEGHDRQTDPSGEEGTEDES